MWLILLMWLCKALKLLPLHVMILCYTHLLNSSIDSLAECRYAHRQIFCIFNSVDQSFEIAAIFQQQKIPSQTNSSLQKACEEIFWVRQPLLDSLQSFYKKISSPTNLGKGEFPVSAVEIISVPSFEFQLTMVMKWNLNSIPPCTTSPQYSTQMQHWTSIFLKLWLSHSFCQKLSFLRLKALTRTNKSVIKAKEKANSMSLFFLILSQGSIIDQTIPARKVLCKEGCSSL